METFEYTGPMRIVEKSDLESMITKIDKIEASMEPGSIEVALKGLSAAVIVGAGLYFMTKSSSDSTPVRAAKEATIARENENLATRLAELKRKTGKE